jgi:hypothetical protein
MNPKSRILLQIEVLEAVQRLKEYAQYLFESFQIDDIVLGIMNNQPQEITVGYMCEAKEFDTLDKALEGFDPCKDCLRVVEGKYYRGKWSSAPVVCEGKILNISNFKEI